ncbi:MAG: arginine--tRNA ligase [Oscillospiraceae bacterium]|nr:arginine--tRNA ligase [Oscillospiraceae bacterium]
MNIIRDTSEQLRSMIRAAMEKAIAEGALKDAPLPEFVVEIPGDTTKGDFATNAAMAGARAFGMAPRKIAEAICQRLSLEGTPFERWEIAGPGFINLFVGQQWFVNILTTIHAEGEAYGRSDYGKGQKYMVEFVSANPTGPMHMGNARGGAMGDCLAAALDWAGYDVTREFYVNDAGNQIEKFGLSLATRYLQIYKGEEEVPMPEDCYQGEDIKVHAAAFAEINGDKYVEGDLEQLKADMVAYALPKNLAKMRADMDTYRINYDVWFMESDLHNSGAVQKVIDTLSANGMTYEKDGALWYKNAEVLTKKLKEQGKTDEQIALLELKDDVLVRANGNPTYFAADIAYHYNKFAERGFDRVINVWGADHHGHVARMKGALDAVGLDGEKLDIVLMQLVRLMKDGKPVKMSKRTGKAITLTDLLEEVPVDAARFIFNLREPGSTLDFDLDLAVEQSNQNPVYYVQYAHARICSILKNLAAEGIEPQPLENCDLSLLCTGEERELLRRLGAMADEIVEAARFYDPARLTKYAIEVATLFHKFYNACRVKCDDPALVPCRMQLCLAVRTVLRNMLCLLKVEAPETM